MGQSLQEAPKDSPFRCDGRGQGPEIQCPFYNMEGLVTECDNPYDHTHEEVEGVKRCPRHGGKAQVDKNRKNQLTTYRIKTLQDDLTHHMSTGRAKDLRNELALSRTLLERLCNTLGEQVQGAAAFAYAGQIQRYISQVESLVKSIQQIESKSGETMGPEEVIALANKFVSIVMKFVPEELHEEAALEIQKCLSKT